MRTSRLLAGLTAMICPSAESFQAPDESAREKDVYAIYSLIFSHPKTSHGAETNARLLIADTTVPGVPPVPCVRPPGDRAADFGEVLTDFEKSKDIRREIKRELSISKPYVLLTAEEVKEFETERMGMQTGERKPNPRFEGVADLFRISDVYFNKSRTLALTNVSSWCGGLCGIWSWRVFEKSEKDAWAELKWVTCATFSNRRKERDKPIAFARLRLAWNAGH